MSTKYAMYVGKWHIWAHENDEGALQIWIKHEDESHEVYLGEWPLADKEEQV